jgi:hypothetical protein
MVVVYVVLKMASVLCSGHVDDVEGSHAGMRPSASLVAARSACWAMGMIALIAAAGLRSGT